MRPWNSIPGLALALIWLVGPCLADPVGIANPAALSNIVPQANIPLAGDFTINANSNVYNDSSHAVYTSIYSLAMPTGRKEAWSPYQNSGGMYDGAGLNWDWLTRAQTAEAPPESTGPGGNDLLAPGMTFFNFSDMQSSDGVTVYAQSYRPPDQLLLGLSEGGAYHATQGYGDAPNPVPEPGTLLLLGGGLSLASLAIRRRFAQRKNTAHPS